MSDVNLAADSEPAPADVSVAGGAEKVAAHFKRSQIQPGSSHYEAPLPRLTDPAEAEALEPGAKFIDPTGTTRTWPRISTAMRSR